MTTLTLEPIGHARTPFVERASAPRQPRDTSEVEGFIELLPGRGFEDALSDLEGWEYLWVIFWFHHNESWRPKVLPPRSAGRRLGVFATRSPHRPNPLGLSVVRLLGVEGLVVRVSGVDMLDGTPVLDIKPYVPYADARPGARSGWLDALSAAPGAGAAPADPVAAYEVGWSELADAQARWLASTHGVELREPAERTLALGPQPHAYRRIKAEGDALRLAIKDWRLRFRVDGRRVVVESIATGYRERDLALSPEPGAVIARAFVERFGR